MPCRICQLISQRVTWSTKRTLCMWTCQLRITTLRLPGKGLNIARNQIVHQCIKISKTSWCPKKRRGPFFCYSLFTRADLFGYMWVDINGDAYNIFGKLLVFQASSFFTGKERVVSHDGVHKNSKLRVVGLLVFALNHVGGARNQLVFALKDVGGARWLAHVLLCCRRQPS